MKNIKIIVILLLVFFCGFGGFFMFKNLSGSKKSHLAGNEIKDEAIIKILDKNVNILSATDSNNEILYKDLFSTTFDISKLTEEEKVYNVLLFSARNDFYDSQGNLLHESSELTNYYDGSIDMEDFRKSYYNLYGEEPSSLPKTLKGCPTYTLVDDSNYYYTYRCGGENQTVYLYKNYGFSKEGKNYYVYQALGQIVPDYGNCDERSCSVTIYDYYKNYVSDEILDNVGDYVIPKDEVDKFTVFKYTFNKTSGDAYVLKGIEEVK